MADKSIRFWDNESQTARDILCVPAGGGLYALAVSTDPPDATVLWHDNLTGTTVKLGLVANGDGTYSLAVVEI
jgi:hypothetical protein